VTSLVVQQPLSRSTVTLSRSEVVDGFFGDPRHPDGIAATFDPRYNENGVRFFRPQRDAEDRNQSDRVDPARDADVDVVITTEDPAGRLPAFSVLVERSDDGKTVTFTPDAPSGTAYRWDFGDGARQPPSAGPATHTYTRDGTYAPTVTARAPDGRRGASRPIARITVGTPPGGGTATTPAPAGSTPAAKGDGGTGGGGSSEASGGGTAGPKSPATGPQRTPRAGSTAAPPGKRTARSGAKATATKRPAAATKPARSTTAATTPAATSSTATGEPARGASRSPSAATDRDAEAASSKAPKKRRAAPATTTAAGPDVTGTLVAQRGDDVTAALAAADALADRPDAPRDAARAGAGGGSSSLAGGIAGGGLIVALLSLGAAREGLPGSRRIRPA